MLELRLSVKFIEYILTENQTVSELILLPVYRLYNNKNNIFISILP